jgi:hypothetical protein
MSQAPSNVVELHPEELIDLEGRGALDAAAVASLDAHCARCVACRYERALRAQFADLLTEHVEERDPGMPERALAPRVPASRR